MEEQAVTRAILDSYELQVAIPVGVVEVRRISIPPTVSPGVHWHNGPVFGTVESGSVHFQVDADEGRVLKQGDVFYEPAGRTITRFDATDEGVTFLAWFPVPPGVVPSLTLGEAPA